MKRIIILACVVALVVLAWSGAWLFVASEVKKQVANLAEADGVTNPKITCAELSTGGYPFAMDVYCRGATVQLQDVTAELAEVRASVLVYQPTHALILASAPLTLKDAFSGNEQRLDFTMAEASARLDGWRIARISVHVENPAFFNTLPSDELIARASLAELHLLDIPEQHEPEKGLAALAIYAPVENLVMPGLQIADGKISVEAELNGLPDDVRALNEPDIVRRWQGAGGTLKLVSVQASDADTFIKASGNLALDAQMRAQGQVQLQSKGIVERLGDRIPGTIRTILLGQQAPDGSYGQTITIRAGVVLVGLIPVGMIPPLL
ncbi:hypothetical protein GCM10011321_37040 [Youhaiella tibetensis]|uniref:DUF2125 domain-containing protein n=1 Tax=Paradevosia tibetensis TaxID=1447062 RepID=A0A5B9DSC4_9HYPH|nr:DUF2125 domain-containing protein [Youhaiella tibetensis]AKR57416.1 hypothetical protein XM25_16840 [Devosia sp. H5989]QEE22350.1 DUF2125 domain-containing protein [Youhaiella tibetensis]GGF43044.1 hypothetical protein GCM10011321_37040 [Youhaiella tibetensis]